MASTGDGIASAIKDKRKEILQLSFKYNGNGSADEVIDILSDYAWSADDVVAASGSLYSVSTNIAETANDTSASGGDAITRSTTSSFTKKNDIPFCYVIERESAVNASFANILNLVQTFSELLSKGSSTVSNAADMLSKLVGSGSSSDNNSSSGDQNNQTEQNNQTGQNNQSGQNNQTGQNNQSGQNTQNSQQTADNKKDGEGNAKETEKDNKSSGSSATQMINTLKDKINGFIKNIGDLGNLLSNNNLNSDLFLPYRYLYITKATNKKFVFPMTNDHSSFGSHTATWGDVSGPDNNKKGLGLTSVVNQLTETVNGFLTETSGLLSLVDNISSNIKGEASVTDVVSEVAKTFKYDTTGETVTINFTLYNTTRLNAWKDNYKFLYLFSLRNLPFRIDATTFVPPLLYDVIIPGIKRLPVCAVSSLNIVPKGMTRTLICNNFLGGSGQISVNVPESWEVSITFQCLIGKSANMMLDGIVGNLNIQTSASTESGKK